MVADGQTPSNEDRGYVLRRILRRAVRHAYGLGVDGRVLPAMVEAVVEVMGPAYPELTAAKADIAGVVGREEERFHRTLRSGSAILDDELKQAAFGELMEMRNLTEPELSVRTRQVLRRELEKLIERELIMKEAYERMSKRGQAWEKLQEYAAKEFDKQMSSYRLQSFFQHHRNRARLSKLLTLCPICRMSKRRKWYSRMKMVTSLVFMWPTVTTTPSTNSSRSMGCL